MPRYDELPSAGFGAPRLPQAPMAMGPMDLSDILRGRGALPGVPLQQGGNPLANYPQARQPGESFGPFLDRSAPELLAPITDTAKAVGMTAAPALSAFGLGMMPTPAEGQTAPSEATRKLQQDLKDKGYFPYKVDGIGGEKTDRANARYQADEAAKSQRAIDAARAQGDIEKERRLREEGERKSAEREAGEARLREMEGQVGPVSRFVRDYGEPLGYGLGVLGGALTRTSAVGTSNALARGRAAQAEQIIDSAARQQVPRQVGAVNETWALGQNRGMGGLGGTPRVPFEVEPTAPLGYQATPGGAPPAAALFQPPRNVMGNTGTDAAIALGGWGTESGVSMVMASKAHDEMAAAQTALQADKSEANIQRYQSARDKVAFWDGMAAMGRTAALTHLGAGAEFPRTAVRPSNLDRAEAMQLRLGRRLP